MSVMAIYRQLTEPRYNSGMNCRLKTTAFALLVGVIGSLIAVAAKSDDTAADSVTAAFLEAREAAHLPKMSKD